mgnify:CR=1 FL=1
MSVIEPQIILIALFTCLLGAAGSEINKDNTEMSLISSVLNVVSIIIIAVILPVFFNFLENAISNLAYNTVITIFIALCSVFLLLIRYRKFEFKARK